VNIADSLKKIQGKLPSGPNGHGSGASGKQGPSLDSVAKQRSMQSMIVLAPLLLAATAAALAMRRNAQGTAADRMSTATGRPKHRRHRPNNMLRYYGLGMLISALERDSTRKAVILGLKWAQKRA